MCVCVCVIHIRVPTLYQSHMKYTVPCAHRYTHTHTHTHTHSHTHRYASREGSQLEHYEELVRERDKLAEQLIVERQKVSIGGDLF